MNRRVIVRSGSMMAVAALATVTLAGCAGLAGGPSPVPGSSTAASTLPLVAGGATTTAAPPPTGGSTTGSTGSASVKTPECKVTDLTLTLGHTGGAAGTIYTAIDFTNKTSHTCVIVGFPGVSYVGNSNGTQIGAPAQRDGQIGAQVTLAPGAVASAIVGMVDVGNFDASVCLPTPVDGLRVYPPDETHSIFVGLSGIGCAGSPPGSQLTVQTIKAGPGSM
jgi:hypothetical protein